MVGQSPVLIPDGSTHAFTQANSGNRRNLGTTVNLSNSTLFLTTLFHVYEGADVVDMRAEFFDGLNAGGNMRGNVGISDGDLFVSAANSGYKPADNSTVASDLVAGNTIMAAILGVAAILRSHAAPVAHEPFAYGGGVNLTTETSNGGTGWAAAWATTGVNGLLTSGTIRSLWFGQSPVLVPDGSTHAFAETSQGNRRDFTTAVHLGSQTLYFTALIHVLAGHGVVDLRAEFFDGPGATGNMRGNVGISGGDLYVNAANSGYNPAGSGVAPGVVAGSTTYLLAMKRTGTAISASLIPANGDPGGLASSEPTWQVGHAGLSGVSLRSIRLLANGSGGGIRIDELRIATSWSGAVGGLALPQPEKTFVFHVDQPATSEATSWKHTVAEAGDYQLGLAWVETLTGGNVALEVFQNSMRVKALYAPPGEVTRFETRL